MNELSFPLLPGEKKREKIASDDVRCGGKSLSCSLSGSGGVGALGAYSW